MRFLLAACGFLAVAACATVPVETQSRAVAPSDMLPSGDAAINEDAGILRNITNILIDASDMYADASRRVDDARLRDELATLARQRGELVTAFQARTTAMGREPAADGELVDAVLDAVFLPVARLFDNDIDVALDAALQAENNLVDEVREGIADNDASDGLVAFLTYHLDLNADGEAARRGSIGYGRNHVEFLRSQYDEA